MLVAARMISRVLVVVGVVAGAPAAQARPAFLPPLEVEVGAASISTPGGSHALATQWMVGASWASAYPGRTPVDVSLGVIVISTGPDAPASPMPASTVDGAGGFLDVALRVDEGRHWRAWLGARGEMLGIEGVGVLGAAGRVSVELWRGVAAGGGGGGIFGTLAISAWAELGVRERPDRSLASTAATGLGVRLPMIFGH